MIKWNPDTCYCSILTEAPSKNGKFLKRCKLHLTTRDTTTVYQHNKDNRLRPNETDDKRKRDLRKSTRR